ncbi:Uncharacterized protein YktA, UPF0223 family [Pelagirhabdus alkalitolerans]|uniref:Uncharacterized protein YktA, UPF0223 family n=1 Tax=Pelagirhabdus alkalitolerans TaxID=1612202 RepID=A0A1G6H1L2_9BACI|nr:UPF0223 family protein [Pelagirhabdus alkalitolerans]SDB87276.1 Uncharacterized protein YktA, UPF0223 family [Pelagirhabdus alkalitolerans]
MNYRFPIDPDWSTDEMVDVVEFLDLVERAYYQSVDSNQLLSHYKKFKQVVPSKSEEKKLSQAFERDSGCSVYRTVKKAQENESVKMK